MNDPHLTITETSETALLEQAKAGNPKAFEELIKPYEPKIYSLVLSMTGNETEAADLFQEAFISAWKNLASFRGTSKFSTWLYRIAVNTVLMKRRKKRVHTVSIDTPVESEDGDMKRDFAGDWSENPLASLENQEVRDRLNKAVAELPEKFKAVLLLSDMQGLKNEEVGKILKISLPNVKSRLHRARLHLRNQLSKYFKDGQKKHG